MSLRYGNPLAKYPLVVRRHATVERRHFGMKPTGPAPDDCSVSAGTPSRQMRHITAILTSDNNFIECLGYRGYSLDGLGKSVKSTIITHFDDFIVITTDVALFP